MHLPLLCSTALAVLMLAAAPAPAMVPGAPVASASATCSDYTAQADAQRAADTRDADGDGIYCESLPCPCLKPGEAPNASPKHAPRSTGRSCTKPRGVFSVGFSATKYPTIRQHRLDAVARGWPRVLVLNRRGADARRARLLRDYPTRDGLDRDEYPPAIGRGRGKGLVRGSNPRGWKADVAYVPASENRGHGATMGIKLRRFCDGTRFRYVFY